MRGREHQDRFLARAPSIGAFLELMEFLPSVYFYAKDMGHRYVGVNRPVLTEIFGLQRAEDLLGRTDLEFQPPALAEAYHAEDRRVMDGGETIPNQVWLVPGAGGMPRWFVSSKTPLRNQKGEVLGIGGVMYPIATPESQADHFGEIQPVIRHFEDHFRESILMKDMAKLAGLSSTHFNQRFRELLRFSPTEFLLRLRIQDARQRLTGTRESIASIALDAGFSDQSHFTKRFRRVTGMTPLQYRKRFG